MGSQDLAHQARVDDFAAVLERTCSGPLPYRKANDVAFGQAWNTYSGPELGFARWARGLPGVVFGTTMEIPYANVEGAEVTPDSARAFGRDLARALNVYLEKQL